MATDVKIAQAIGTLGYAAAAGGIATLSAVCIPNITALAQFPANSTLSLDETRRILQLSHQWLDLYDRGHKIFPSITAFASIANIYVFWELRNTQTRASRYLLAASVAMSIVPWTFLTMVKTNDQLDAHALHADATRADTRDVTAGSREKSNQTVKYGEILRLLKKWAKLNLARAMFPLAGALIGFCTAVSSR
ncbi:hypothetical protein N7532_011839 [Penicillium argentinense]|uniref:Uncharacterized protein n=1 Tax=Penicillium argentinense TaxID=1131581 RepID=A0A9W9EJG5_9EURO|nr:uncharacterized protein N7532_011839 [Penicillium argentinense]KAJ5082796.1 hypothetical protein N7532_011839 [Penicillium argentinense]